MDPGADTENRDRLVLVCTRPGGRSGIGNGGSTTHSSLSHTEK